MSCGARSQITFTSRWYRPRLSRAESMYRTRPSAPERMISRSLRTAALYSNVCPTISCTPCTAAASTMASASATDVAMGFSTSTCLPALIACRATSACAPGGVATSTASTSSSTSASDVAVPATDG
ncbi:hypothetical protein BJF90_28285 [Pseudonocardia sp. CNS-004]|nr:hypothetical protein BJF90_28285 [Pseudonocardia sp. CNS-004]